MANFSVKNYTGQKKFTRAPPVAPVTNMRYGHYHFRVVITIYFFHIILIIILDWSLIFLKLVSSLPQIWPQYTGKSLFRARIITIPCWSWFNFIAWRFRTYYKSFENMIWCEIVFSVRFLLLDNSLGSATGSHLYHRCDTFFRDDGNFYDCDIYILWWSVCLSRKIITSSL